MYRKVALSLSAMMLLAMLLMGNSAAKGDLLATPTATPIGEPLDFPGVHSILPGKFMSEASPLLDKLGYSLSAGRASLSQADNERQEWGVLFQDYQIGSGGRLMASRISAGVVTEADIIQETHIHLHGRNRDPIPDAEWRLFDPVPIFHKYGTPSFVRTGVSISSAGFGGSLLAIWETDQAAVQFSFYLTDEDIQRDRFVICLTQNHLRGASAWLSLPPIDVKETIVRTVNTTPLIFGQPFSPTMFTNAPNLTTFAQRLANGECLETPREVWFK